MMAHAYKPRTQEARAGESFWLQGQPTLLSEFKQDPVSKIKIKQKKCLHKEPEYGSFSWLLTALGFPQVCGDDETEAYTRPSH